MGVPVELRHGVDIVEVKRIAEMFAEHGDAFWARCFTAAEREYCEQSKKRCYEHAAARFAAKEAVMKALGTGLADGLSWTNVEVVRDERGAPVVNLTGQAIAASRQLGIRHWAISLSHTENYAVASVIATG